MRKLVLIVIIFVFFACESGKDQKNSNVDTQTTSQEVSTKDYLTGKDSIYMISIINELTGIKKFYVKEDFNRLASLLKYMKSNKYEEVASILGELSNKYYDVDDFYPRERIDTIINSSGFLKYYSPFIHIDGTMTYWKQSDGISLIGQEKLSEGGEVNLYFEQFESGKYIEADLSSIIPSINVILENESVERFILPQKGKNIMIQTENQNHELVWNDGVFEKVK